MNGELLHMVKIVTNGNSFLKDEVFLGDDKDNYVGINFYMLSKQTRLMKLLGRNENKIEKVANSEINWYEYLKAYGFNRVYFDLGRTNNSDINLSAFANGLSKWKIITCSPRQKVSWHKNWKFNKDTKKWSIDYYGVPVVNFSPKPLKDEVEIIERLNNSMLEISNFAKKIGFDSWAKYFNEGRLKLHEELIKESRILPISYNDTSFKLLHAISSAWGFGGMGSWNDSPPYYAHDKGLDDEYNRVTNNLYETYLKTLEWLSNNF